jgi:hypothetical protein
MLFLLGIIGLATAVPLWMDYRTNPSDNILVRSRNDAVRDAQKVVTEIALTSAAGQPQILNELPAWLRILIAWGLKLALRMLRLRVGPVARA